MAQVKHYAVYNQETYRNTTQDDAVVSERAEREIYLPAFESAVQQAKVDSVMCSYASVNGTFACENGWLLNTVLKQQWGFTGFVTSDWGGTHSTVASANNGLDQEMTGSTYFGDALIAAVNSGQVSQATIDDHVRRILTSMFASGLFDSPPTGTMGATVTSAAHVSTATKTAEEGSVLLKNSGPILPVGSSTSSIAVIGDDAGANAMTAGGGSAHVNPSTLSSVVTPYQGIKSRSTGTVTYAQGVASPNGQVVDSSYLAPSSGSGTGLTGQYYNNTGMTGTPVLTPERPERQLPVGRPAAGLRPAGQRLVGEVDRHPQAAHDRHVPVRADQRRRQPAVRQRAAGDQQLGGPAADDEDRQRHAHRRAAGQHRGRLLPGRRRQPGQPRLADPQPEPATTRPSRRRAPPSSRSSSSQAVRARAAT